MEVSEISSHPDEPLNVSDPCDSDYEQIVSETMDFEETVCQVIQVGDCCVGKDPVPGFTHASDN